MRERYPDDSHVRVPLEPLGLQDAAALVAAGMARSRLPQLDTRQTEILLQKEEIGSPLYAATACRLLRRFSHGDRNFRPGEFSHGGVTEVLEGMPGSLGGLFDHCVKVTPTACHLHLANLTPANRSPAPLSRRTVLTAGVGACSSQRIVTSAS
jgi:hypothetical protein